MAENKTANFLGNPYNWSKASLKLQDVQPLFGGVIVYLPRWTMSQAYVTLVATGGKETKYRLTLAGQEKKQLCQLCLEQDFLTIQPEERAGIPDEARPTITLSNAKNESHTISKWAGVKDARFDAVYQALLALARRTADQKPMPIRFQSWQKALVIAGLAVSLLGIIALAYAMARSLVANWWPDRFGLLFGLLPVLSGLLLAAVLGLAWTEHHKPKWERTYSKPWFLGVINISLFLVLIGLIGLGETALDTWRSHTPVAGEDERYFYAVLAYTAVFTAGLFLAAASVVASSLLRMIDERF